MVGISDVVFSAEIYCSTFVYSYMLSKCFELEVNFLQFKQKKNIFQQRERL